MRNITNIINIQKYLASKNVSYKSCSEICKKKNKKICKGDEINMKC